MFELTLMLYFNAVLAIFTKSHLYYNVVMMALFSRIDSDVSGSFAIMHSRTPCIISRYRLQKKDLRLLPKIQFSKLNCNLQHNKPLQLLFMQRQESNSIVLQAMIPFMPKNAQPIVNKSQLTMVDNSIIGFLFQADKQQRKTLKIYKRQRIIKNATAVMINKTLKLILNCVLKVLCILFHNNLSQINYAKSNILTS